MNQELLFTALLQKYLEDTLTPEERVSFGTLLANPDHQQLLEQVMKHNYDNSVGGMGWTNERRDSFVREILQSIITTPQTQPAQPRLAFIRRSWKWAAAAAFISIAMLFLYKNRDQAHGKLAVATIPSPGHTGAILTLADGRQLVLDSLSDGVVAAENGTKAMLENGQLVYNEESNANNAVAYNTMATPVGRQFLLVLPDGSKAWLNAASSIRYPLHFNGNERIVEITGEVFFEIIHSREPFKVKTGNMVIEDMGTAFNVNAYTDEVSVNTTLVEGAVKVAGPAQTVLLQPGQQASYNQANTGKPLTVINDINIEEVIAWKNGLFHYEHTDLKTILRQLARWYNLDVQYNGEVPADKFFMIMKRNSELAAVLRVLQTTGIQFRLEGRRLYVGKQ